MTKEDEIEQIEELQEQEEVFTFDKFIDDILIKESVRKPVLIEETPSRKYVKKYIERASNRIKFTRTK